MNNNKLNFKLSAIAFSIMLANSSAFADNTTLVSNHSFLSNSSQANSSDDGSKLTFVSSVVDLNGNVVSKQQAYLKDFNTIPPTIKLISVSNTGETGNDRSFQPKLSGDGNFVVFRSKSTNLVSNDDNNIIDIFVYDIKNESIKLVSSNSSGELSDKNSFAPSISSNGNYVVFNSMATNLSELDTHGRNQVYVKNLVTNNLELISADEIGNPLANGSFTPSISNDGRYVTFVSYSPVSYKYEIVLHDRTLKTTEVITKNHSGINLAPNISGDGRYIAFHTDVADFFSGDTNDAVDVIIYNVSNKTFHPVKTNSILGNDSSYSPMFSENGRFTS